ncbi:carbonic anhydrase 1-like isoform X2 [Rhinatrema bivittatum]|uniref:carbonic anhydrase 1-like isoform X2 n=1 Tax=Rhinatrema bivittatum TaxID=194408 RepID=UPI00112DBFEA|nr:carbonic anhydrase 1-like isoform X2 [Rhinatrema bivittatum]
MASQNWGYDAHNGPDQWNKLFPGAKRNHQSPIDIKTKRAKHDSALKPLNISYDPATASVICNTGHSFKVQYEDKENRSVLKGGPLTGIYRLSEFHFHWGLSDDSGSEHTVDGVKHAAELHVVHWNADKYSSSADASRHPDGWAILGAFVKGKQAPFANFDPSTLLPGSQDYWTYHGSQTYPPLLECVTWIIFKEPITLSSQQLAKFRSLLCSAEREKACPILTNHRPPQLLKGREVKASFH